MRGTGGQADRVAYLRAEQGADSSDSGIATAMEQTRTVPRAAHGHVPPQVSDASPFRTHPTGLTALTAKAIARFGWHPTIGYALAGFAAATLTVVAGGRTGTVRVTIPLTSWFGLL